MKSFFFWFFFSNFKLRHKIPWLAASWLPWQPRQKSGFMVLCELFLCTTLPPSQFWKNCENWFLSYVCYRVWPIRGLAWLPWQPDWNNNHFQKVRVMGFVVVYIHVGWHLGKCSNLMLKIGLLTIEPPLRLHCKNNRNFTDSVNSNYDKKSMGNREFTGKCPYILYINNQFTVLLRIS